MKRKYLTAVLLAVILAVLLTGCSGQPQTEDGRIKIVCTIFPQYDWTRQVLGELEDEAEVTLLMKNGSDLHSYQPTVWDMVAISEADLFFYIGGTSDFWVQDALANVKNPDQIALDLMEVLEGALKEEEHDHDHEHEEHVHGDHENMTSISGFPSVMLRPPAALSPGHWRSLTMHMRMFTGRMQKHIT